MNFQTFCSYWIRIIVYQTKMRLLWGNGSSYFVFTTKIFLKNCYHKTKSSNKMSLSWILPFHYVSMILTYWPKYTQITFNIELLILLWHKGVFYILEQVKTQPVDMDGAGRIWVLFATLIVPLLSLGEWNNLWVKNHY